MENRPKGKCALIANGATPEPVCGHFQIRVGSETINGLRRWLDEIELTSAPTALFGMVVWKNEDYNLNISGRHE